MIADNIAPGEPPVPSHPLSGAATQQGGIAWTPEMVTAVGAQLNGLADRIVKAIESLHKREVKAEMAEGNRELKLVGALLAFAAIVVLVAGTLASQRIVSGDGFMFLAGTLIGSLIVLVQKLLTLRRGVGAVEEE